MREKVIGQHVKREKMSSAENIFTHCPDERHSLGSISNRLFVGIDVLQALTVKSGCNNCVNQGGNAG